jgi:hypothetical protein
MRLIDRLILPWPQKPVKLLRSRWSCDYEQSDVFFTYGGVICSRANIETLTFYLPFSKFKTCKKRRSWLSDVVKIYGYHVLQFPKIKRIVQFTSRATRAYYLYGRRKLAVIG